MIQAAKPVLDSRKKIGVGVALAPRVIQIGSKLTEH
jgi:hypothetical protein